MHVLQVVYSLKHGDERQQTWKLLLGRGRGDDVAASLNPAAGRGLTHLVRHGCALHQRATGSGLGVAARLSDRVHAAAAQLVSGSFRDLPHSWSAAVPHCIASDRRLGSATELVQRQHISFQERQSFWRGKAS